VQSIPRYRLNYFQLENLVSMEKLRLEAERAGVIIAKVQNFLSIFLLFSPFSSLFVSLYLLPLTFSTGSSVPFYLTPLCPRGTTASWMEDNKLETIRRPLFATQHEHAFSFKARYRWVAIIPCARGKLFHN